jgi:lipopolysaccharide/colanic/teichoic acid biosynthesis glycosyltransferase
MATTAAELTTRDTDYVDPSLIALRTEATRSKARAAFQSSVLPFPGPFELEVPLRFELAPAIPSAMPVGNDRVTRAIDIVVATLALIVAAPLMVLIAIAIKLTSRGPVLYKQTRIGLDRRANRPPSHTDSRVRDLGGKPFTMYKFRTMVTAAESDSKEVWAKPDDARVTAVGRRLRVARLDEIPQLFNVLAGDMSIVGPRPERPTIFAEMREAIPNYHLRQRVMPGITGWAQINQAYDTCVDDVRRKVEYDLEYLNTRTVRRDLRIMARTVPIMLFCRFGW